MSFVCCRCPSGRKLFGSFLECIKTTALVEAFFAVTEPLYMIVHPRAFQRIDKDFK